ncbi:MAG: single-stranded-DNA-specific exonuclease RecJ [Odoribacteraceae bacterium]|jgi:single-stranded-DNA-specific exonuclease|nr:single-stranded-DNA-specific exonuclease RecJ [Odoribacteraceae bacterium]
MEKTWVVNPPPDEKKIKQLSEAIPCSPIIASLLLQRDVTSAEAARAFFNPALDMLHDPFLMKDMDKAVDRIDRAVANNEDVMIYGDYDVDGTTAVALLYKHFKSLFHRLEYYIPMRYVEGSGISIRAIDMAVERGVSLMIVTDCGVKSIEQVDYARRKGLDVIICDHHTTGEEIPNAVAVLDPRRVDCPYPYKWLSGCGVSFKLAQAYNLRRGLPMKKLHAMLDLVCVSIASDIVPVTGENRVLARFGLLQLNTNPCLGLKTIIGNAATRELTINDVVIRVGPKINAAGRMESGDKSVELLLAEEESEARRVAESLDAFNDRRKKLDHEITEEALKSIRDNGEKATVLYNPGWHNGVIGIVALRLMEHYYRPTVILTEAEGVVIGSARSVEGYDLYEAISRCSEHLINYGGHKYAVGLTLERRQIDAFRAAFQRVVRETIPDALTRPQINIDARVQLDDVTPELYNTLQQFAPFGPDNASPVFLTTGLSDFGTRQVGRQKEHLQLQVIDDARARDCDESRPRVYTDRGGIAFGMGNLYPRIANGEIFDVCYTLQRNELSRKENDVQMLVRDIRFQNNR